MRIITVFRIFGASAVLAVIAYSLQTSAGELPANPGYDRNATLPFQPNIRSDQQSLERFADKKFGIYINWGPFTLSGKESSWSMTNRAEYEAYYQKWRPKNFDIREWSDLTKTLGVNYIVWVTKHHDGLALWDTQESTNKITNLPFKRNLTTEVARMARRKAGYSFWHAQQRNGL